MNFLNKIKNSSIIKCLLIILLFAILIAIGYKFINARQEDLITINNIENAKESIDNSLINIVELNNEIKGNIIEEKDSKENKNSESTIKDVKKEEVKEKEIVTQEETTKIEEQKENKKEAIDEKKQTNEKVATNDKKEETETKVEKQEIVKVEVENSQTIIEEKTEENIKEEIEKDDQSAQKVVEEYKINTALIEKMKKIILDNPSEIMIKYGYNIVSDDETITSKTNQFTFSELNVKSKIKNRFGTIKIYARDYYCNNEYVSTQCFIY